MRIVDSEVSSFSSLQAMPAAASWLFERLPSQQNLSGVAAQRQAMLEAMAAKELSKWGFMSMPQKEGAAVIYSIQLGLRIQRLERGPLDDPWDRYGVGLSGRASLMFVPMWPLMPPPWYVRELSLLVRDVSDGRVVYETSAKHEGRWVDDENVLGAMFSAAMQGFPKPAEGRRVVNIEITRSH